MNTNDFLSHYDLTNEKPGKAKRAIKILIGTVISLLILAGIGYINYLIFPDKFHRNYDNTDILLFLIGGFVFSIFEFTLIGLMSVLMWLIIAPIMNYIVGYHKYGDDYSEISEDDDI